MKISLAFLTALWLGLMVMPAHAGETGEEVRMLLENQAGAWNAGDIPGFMEGYWKSDKLRFASAGEVTYGWQDTLENFQRGYPTPERMGRLSFSDIDIKVLSETFALAFGRWDLERQGDDIGGLFTLLVEKRPEGWRIIADHTSSDDLPIAVVAE